MTAEPLGRWLKGAFTHQQPAQSRREFEGGGEGDPPALDGQDDNARVEDGMGSYVAFGRLRPDCTLAT